jgi:hypothetical protein
MSVRRRRWRDPVTGASKECWGDVDLAARRLSVRRNLCEGLGQGADGPGGEVASRVLKKG